MNLSFRSWFEIALAVLLFGAVVAGLSASEKAVRLSFEKDSVIAVNDTTRKLKDFYLRRVVQTEFEKDSINKLLKTTTKVKANIAVKVPKVEVDGTTVVQRPDSAPAWPLLFQWEDLYQKPYKIGLQVNVFNPDSVWAGVSVVMDPIPLSVRIECGEEKDGVRPASLLVAPGDSLDFLEVHIDSVAQSREVCIPKPRALNIPRSSAIKTALKAGLIGSIIGAATAAFIQSHR